ncbi:MAG: efflux RND transporter periplasmic adaptor subunit [Pseudomonadales bacterium]|nr:efflux RND transporter periplasmic adaptor subunit [Pseudomonadales bacterium]
MNKLSKNIKYAAPLLVVAAGFAGFALLHWSKPEPEQRTEAPRPLSVFVEKVESASLALQVQAEGEVRAGTVVDLVSQVAGRVVAVSAEFTEGGMVQPGVALVEIEPIDFQLALAQAEARLAEAEVALQTAVATADVARKQLRNASQASDLALKKPQVAEARARLEAASADLQQARLNLARTSIALPFAGRLMSTLVDVGQYVTPGMPLGRAFGTDKVEVRLPLSDNQLASLGIAIGYIAEADAGLDVVFSAQVAGSQQSWRGKLVRLDAAIDPATRMLYATAEVQAPYTTQLSDQGMPMAVGLYVHAEIQGRQVSDAFVIPRDALRAGNKVYVVNTAGKLDIRHVQLTHSTATEAVVASGLAVGERVVVSSIRNAINGMDLEALDSAATGTAVAKASQTKQVGG